MSLPGVSVEHLFTFSPMAFVAAIEGTSFTDDHCKASEKCLPAILNHSVLSGRLSSHMIAITTVFAKKFVCHDSWIDRLRRTEALSAPPADILNLYLFGKNAAQPT